MTTLLMLAVVAARQRRRDVTDLEEKTSHAGNAYDVFSVCEHGSCIHASIFGRPAIAEGKTVTAAGTFAAVKHLGSYTYRNEIDLDEGSLS